MPSRTPIKAATARGALRLEPFPGAAASSGGGGAQKKKKQLPLQAENVAETFSTGESFDVALSSAK